MPYQVMDAETGVFWLSIHTGRPSQFETGEAAQMFAKQLAAENGGRKFRVKRVLDDNWRQREQDKFERGVYEYLPWTGEGWWECKDARDVHRLHYAHVSKKEPGMVAYTASPEDGADNKRTRIKPGRYLEKYFSHVAAKYGLDLQFYAKKFTSQYEPKKVFFAKTEDEIQAIYERGPASCMSSAAYRKRNGWGYPIAGEWPDNIHACRVYAAGDLEVAYLLENDEKPKSKVIARSLVWPAKKTHSRCYGDEVRLKTQLQMMGYTFNAPMGAKLLRIAYPKDAKNPRQFIVPYIDAGDRSGQGALALKDMKDHLLIVRQEAGTYPANATSGLSGGRYNAHGEQDDGSGYCVNCEEDDRETVRVHYSNAPGDWRHWCHDCISESDRIFICNADGRHYDAANVERITMANGETWSGNGFRQYGFTCARSGGRYNRSERTTVKVNIAGKSEYWARSQLAEHAFKCKYTGDYYSNSQKVAMHDGTFWSKQAVRHAGFICEECKEGFGGHEAHTIGGKVCKSCAAKHTTIKNTPAKVADDVDASLGDILAAAVRRVEEQPR